MLKLGVMRKGWLYWGEEDVLALSKIVGPEAAAQRSAPWSPSIVRLAERNHILLSKKVRAEYSIDTTLRRVAKELKKLDDYPVKDWKQGGRHALWPHQRADLYFMHKMRMPAYLIAHTVGGGKTPEAIRWARGLARANRILILCTNSAKWQWVDEIRRWDSMHSTLPLPITVIDGSKAMQTALAKTPNGWVVGHHESLLYAREGYLKSPWDAVIVDEIHNFQNRKARRTEVLQLLEAKNRAALTADPYSNNPDELFPILQFLYPEQYTNHERFFHMHVSAVPKAFGQWHVDGPKRPKLLQWELEPFMLRRVHIAGRHKLTRTRRVAVLSPASRKEYEKLKKQFFVELDAHAGAKKILAIPSVLARVTRLRQYLIDPGLLGARAPSEKYAIVEELLAETDRPTVIFTSFRAAAIRLSDRLKELKLRVGQIHRGISPHDRRVAQKKFQAGKLNALVIVMKAGSESLNLGGYGSGILLDLPWNFRMLNQCEGRVNRPRESDGKHVPTTMFRIVTANSYEEKMEAKLVDKFNMFKKVFTVAELKELFA